MARRWRRRFRVDNDSGRLHRLEAKYQQHHTKFHQQYGTKVGSSPTVRTNMMVSLEETLRYVPDDKLTLLALSPKMSDKAKALVMAEINERAEHSVSLRAD